LINAPIVPSLLESLAMVAFSWPIITFMESIVGFSSSAASF
jgi:hypothetical protein